MTLPPRAIQAMAGTMVLLLACEWLLPGPGGIAPIRMPMIPATAADSDAAIGQWGDNVLARPLFYPDRQPVSDAGAGTDASLPRLSAIIIIGGTRAAVFSADGQKPQVVPAGSSIGGYRLEQITPSSVQLLGPDGALTLHPQFLTPTGTAAPAANQSNNEENN